MFYFTACKILRIFIDLLNPLVVMRTAVLEPHGSYKLISKASWKFVYTPQEASEKLFVALMRLQTSN